jgi:hypothetical protein
MSAILVTVLLGLVTFAMISFTSYWIGVGHQQRRTRKWARRALAAENLCLILHEAILDGIAAMEALKQGETPLSDDEYQRFVRLAREAGL